MNKFRLFLRYSAFDLLLIAIMIMILLYESHHFFAIAHNVLSNMNHANPQEISVYKTLIFCESANYLILLFVVISLSLIFTSKKRLEKKLECSKKDFINWYQHNKLINARINVQKGINEKVINLATFKKSRK